MKIKDIPQVGKLGLTVTWLGRNDLNRRTLVTPANPRTAAQQAVRDVLQQQARRFDALTPVQQDAWNTAASEHQSRPTLGQSGPLTGLQMFTEINCALAQLGQDPGDAPPLRPQFGALAPQNPVITSPGTNTVPRASK